MSSAKRKREDVELDIRAYRNKKRAVEKLLARAEAELAVMDAAAVEARALRVPYWAFARAALASTSAWVQEPFDSTLYNENYACGRVDGCYYHNSGDVKNQTLYVVRPVEGPPVVVCDVCDRDSDLFDDDWMQKRVRVDPDAFEPAIAAVLRQVAVMKINVWEDIYEINDKIDALFDALPKNKS